MFCHGRNSICFEEDGSLHREYLECEGEGVGGTQDIDFDLFSRILTHSLYENESLLRNECCDCIGENQIRTGKSKSSE